MPASAEEQAEDRLGLVSGRHRVEFGCVADNEIATRLCLLAQGLTLKFPSGSGPREGRSAATQNNIRPRFEQMFGDRSASTLLEGIGRALLRRCDWAIAFAIRHAGELRRRRGGAGTLNHGH
ncbi:hypothetical protein NRB_13280 [Novosphingobium sp. 11B]